MKIHIKHKNEKIKFVFQRIIDMMCIACLAGVILLLCQAQNDLAQNFKDISAAKAFFLFAVFMFITQKVRLFNWQSVVATLLYLPIGYSFRMRYSFAPDLFNRDRVVVWIVWIVLLIAVDMAVYKKVNPLEKFNGWALLAFSAMAVTMMYNRNSKSYPVIFILVFLFYLIPIDKEGWERLLNQFCVAWLISFFVILYRSLKNNPELDLIEGGGRWYGDFVNIGDFGLFMACVLVVILFKLYQSKKSRGRLSVPYILYFICLIPILWTAFRVSTITMFIGIAFVFFMGFILLAKNSSIKTALIRLAITVAALLLLGVLGYMVLTALANTDSEYWKEVSLSENIILKPIANIITRAHYMFDEPRTFANSDIFEPDSLLNYLDLFTSGRLSIMKVFSEYFNYTGNPTDPLQVGTYWAYNAHNAYTQVIFEYGYIGGGAFILWFVYSAIASAGQYIKDQCPARIFTCAWMVMTLGIMMGERVNTFFPTIFMAFLLAYPIVIKSKLNISEQ